MRYGKESLIRAVLWKRLGEHLVFCLKIKWKSNKPWRNFPMGFSSGLVSPGEQKAERRQELEKHVVTPIEILQQKEKCRSKTICNESQKSYLTMFVSLVPSAGPNISRGRRWMENLISEWNRSVTSEFLSKECLWTGLRRLNHSQEQ